MSISTNSIANLDSYYQQLISLQISSEQKPMDAITKQVDDLKIQKALYGDLNTKFTAFQSSIKALLSSDPFYSMEAGRSTTISSSSTQSVISATADSAAIVGNYTINVTQLATGQKARSDQQAYSDQALNLTGTFVIGGGETRSLANASVNDTVGSFSTSGTMISGQTELGTNSYSVETRQSEEGVWQFRLVDETGNAISIRNEAAANNSLTTSWQAIPTGGGAYDTGKGLTFEFGADSNLYTANYRTTSAASVDYTALGGSISVLATDSLNEIANKINNADYATGNEISATIVDKQLIIQTTNTGETKSLAAADVGSGTVLQDIGVLTSPGVYKNYSALTDASRNADFTINGLQVIRSSNTAITDVILGVSLNLAPNSEGLSATLSVVSDSKTTKSTVDTFISKFNDLSKYVKGKIATTKNEDETYSRGGLAGDMTFRLFNSNMFTTLNGKYENTGEYSYLFELGLEFNDENELIVADSTKLTDALTNNFNDVELLFEEVMTSLNNKVSIFTGTTGYVESAIETNDNQTTFYNSRITSMKARLELRKTQLTNQYLLMQAQIEQMTNQQATLQAGFINYSS
ncbi:MAG: flagellar filament capping protein FliD [Anaerolineaceae bacterium]|nr:flagellar filament capping protein FliD [Anaerolineaceae bacterium]